MKNQTRKYSVGLAVMQILTILVLLFNVYFILETRERPWAPLAEYPTQQIVNATKRLNNAWVIPFGEPVVVKGVKCAVSDAPVSVTRTFGWSSRGPLVTSIEVGRGSSQRLSCDLDKKQIEFTFTNEPTQSVIERSVGVKQRTDKWPVWTLIGVETPYRDGEEGKSSSWRTEPFILVPLEEYNKIGEVGAT